MKTSCMTRYNYTGHNNAMVASVVWQLRAERYSAYAETERDTTGALIAESIMTDAPLSMILMIAGHGHAFTRDI